MSWIARILPRKSYFVGIDVGTAEIKVAGVKLSSQGPEVVDLRRCPSPSGVWEDVFDEEKLINSLQEVANPRVKEAISCLAGGQVVTRIIRLPSMSDREREKAVRLEVERLVPTPIDQLIIRSLWIDGTGHANGGKVLVLAAPTSLVYRYHAVFSRTGLVLGVLDLPAFALYRLFRREIQGASALVDVGARSTNLVVVENQRIVFLRTFNLGGDVFTRSASEYYGVDFDEAERMKLEAAATVEDAFRGGLMELGRELRRSLEFCATQEGVKVQEVILCGGGAKFKPLPSFLEGMLGVKVGVKVPDLPLSSPYDPAFAVAIGLALREVEPVTP